MNRDMTAAGAATAGGAFKAALPPMPEAQAFEGSTRFASSLVRASVDVDDRGMARFAVTGVLTQGCVRALRKWIAGATMRYGIAGAVIDFTGLVVAVSAVVLLDQGCSAIPADIPFAAIVTDQTEELFREWAWLNALAGAMRSVFREESRARAWVEDRAWIPRSR